MKNFLKNSLMNQTKLFDAFPSSLWRTTHHAKTCWCVDQGEYASPFALSEQKIIFILHIFSTSLHSVPQESHYQIINHVEKHVEKKVLYMKSSCKIILQMNQNELNPYVSMLFPDFLYPKIQPKKVRNWYWESISYRRADSLKDIFNMITLYDC